MHIHHHTMQELWSVFSTDDKVRPFLISHGGTRAFLRQHPNDFILEESGSDAVIRIAGETRGRSSRGTQQQTHTVDQDHLLWRIQNFVEKRGSCSNDKLWEVFGSDDEVRPFLIRQGGTRTFLRQHPDMFAVSDDGWISLVGGSRVHRNSQQQQIDFNHQLDEDQLVWRIQNFVQKQGGTASNEQVWNVFGSDDEVRPFLIANGGTRNFLRQHPDKFAIEDYGADAMISLIDGPGYVAVQRGGYKQAQEETWDEDQLVWRIQNFIQKQGGTVTNEKFWETFGSDDDVRPFLIARGGSRMFLMQHPEVFVVQDFGREATISLVKSTYAAESSSSGGRAVKRMRAVEDATTGRLTFYSGMRDANPVVHRRTIVRT